MQLTLADTRITTVPFRADRLLVVEREGEPFVPMRPIVTAMGLDWKSQHAKLTEGRFQTCVVEITTQLPGDPQRRAVTCLPLRKLAGWLMTISPNKVKPELRETVMAYQAECDDVLWQHWSGQHRKAETQAEKYWFTRRPHWRAIRSLVFDGLTYAQAGQRLGRSAGSVGRCVRRMVQVGLIDPVQFIRLRYLPHTAERLVAANKQMCLQWGVAP